MSVVGDAAVWVRVWACTGHRVATSNALQWIPSFNLYRGLYELSQVRLALQIVQLHVSAESRQPRGLCSLRSEQLAPNCCIWALSLPSTTPRSMPSWLIALAAPV